MKFQVPTMKRPYPSGAGGIQVPMKRQRSVRAPINNLSNYALLQEGIHQNSMGINDMLPEEMLFHHIFLRLSTKTLICCRSVCKAWNRLIRDPRFVRHHLNLQENKQKLLARASDNRFYSIDYEEDGGEWFNLPAQEHSRHPGVLTCCNGLLGMYIDHHIHPAAYNLYLWNLVTRESKLIPDPDPYIRDDESLGFGYDSSMDDYKFIRVIEADRMDVYSLRSNSWNIVNLDYSELKHFKTDNGFGVGVNGYLYWEIRDPDSDPEPKLISHLSIVGLRLTDYHTTETRMPHDMLELGDADTSCGWGLVAIGNCLALHIYQMPGNFVVWTLKENDERKWEKLMTLSLSFPDDKWFWGFKPVWVTKEGKVVIFFVEGYGVKKRYNKLGLYDLQKKSFKYVPISGDDDSYFCTTMAHVQSLVSPNMF